MTDTFDVFGCLESLWYYGTIPTPLPLHNTINSSSAPNFTHSSCASSSVSTNLFTSARPIPAGSLQSLFSMMDEDGDGQLRLYEMRSLLDTLGIISQSNDLASLIEMSILTPKHTSSTRDLSLDFPQFAKLYTSFFTASQDCPTQHPTCNDANDGFDDDLLDMFNMYDANHDGFISASELAAVLLDMGLLPDHCGMDAHLSTCQAYIDSADLDSNGLVDLEEFKSMMMYNHPPTSEFSCFSFS